MKMKFKSLKIQLIVILSILVFVISFTLGIISYFAASNILLDEINRELPLHAQSAGREISSVVETYLLRLEAVANRTFVRSMEWETQKIALIEEIERNNYLTMAIVNKTGLARYIDESTLQLGDRGYVIEAFRGRTNISDPIVSRATGTVVFMIATPIYASQTNDIEAVLIARIAAEELSGIVTNINLGGSGYAFMISEKGAVIAHNNIDLVYDQRNFIEESKTNPIHEELARVLMRMTKQETASDNYYGSLEFLVGNEC
jgi:methyl-accepting chemotaxis protein